MEILEILLVLSLAVYGIYNSIKWKKSSNTKRIFAAVAILSAIVIAYNGIQEWRKDRRIERIEAVIGEIKDLQGAQFPRYQIDDSGTFLHFPPGAAFASDGQPILGAYIIGGKLYVYAIVRDFDGKAVAVIEKNEWTRYDSDFEFNNDETAFEVVKKGDRDVYFRIELKTELLTLLGGF